MDKCLVGFVFQWFIKGNRFKFSFLLPLTTMNHHISLSTTFFHHWQPPTSPSTIDHYLPPPVSLTITDHHLSSLVITYHHILPLITTAIGHYLPFTSIINYYLSLYFVVNHRLPSLSPLITIYHYYNILIFKDIK